MSSSKLQKRFFQLVHDVQSGKRDPSTVSPEVRKTARNMETKDVRDFIETPEKGLPWRVKKEVLSVLGGIREPMYLNEEEINPITNTFTVKGKFEDYVKRFIAQPLSPKELEAIDSFKETKPTKIERLQITYNTTDNFRNNTTTIIKKLKEGNDFVFTSFSKIFKDKEDTETPGEEIPGEEEMPETEENNIRISKSTPFDDEIKGGAILAEFLKRLDL